MRLSIRRSSESHAALDGRVLANGRRQYRDARFRAGQNVRISAVNVYLLGTPLQALNAIEAQKAYEAAPHESVVLAGSKAGSSQRAISQLESAVALGEWGRVHSVQAERVIYWHRQYAECVERLAAEYPKIDTVFIGSYRSAAMNHAVRRLHPTRVVLLDDGIATLAVANERMRGTHVLPARGLVKALGLRAAGLKLAAIPALEFFSTYELNVREPDSYQACTYESFQAALADKPVNNSVLLLGTPASEDGIMSAQRYVDVLVALSQHFEGRTVDYFAHRRESKETLRAVSALPGFNVSEPTECFEMTLRNSPHLPAVVTGLFSSGLITASRLIGGRSKVQGFRVAADLVEAKYRHAVASAYESMAADPHIVLSELEC